MSKRPNRYVVCIANEGCDDLDLRKLYAVVAEERSGEESYLRVIDESGEDYLYPASYFVPVELSDAAAAALSAI